jgi:hypothetical protein
MMTQKFVEGDKVICIVPNSTTLVLGKVYTITGVSNDIVKINAGIKIYSSERFRLATPLMEALV